jgi:3-oxoacyl-[acyl-carrier-protein] synthase II
MDSSRILIRGLSTISPLGASRAEVDESVRQPECRASIFDGTTNRAVFRLTTSGAQSLRSIAEQERYARLDRVTQLALAAARGTLIGNKGTAKSIGCVSIGSSRGATITLEKSIRECEESDPKVPTYTSPITTAGNISSWVAQECLAVTGQDTASLASLNTSMTCSSAFHSLLTALAFVRGDMAEAALFGGAEACLTPYTLAHLDALRISSELGTDWPCRPGNEDLLNTVVLGEGSGTAILCRDDGVTVEGDLTLLGIGWALESTPTATGVSADGASFEAAMRRAVASLPPGASVDCVVAHAPGSIRGDDAELSAIRRVFGDVRTCSTKHMTGHTYGASGMVSLALAQSLLYGSRWPGFPYRSRFSGEESDAPKGVLINTAGFGGNCVTIIVGRPASR